MGRSEKAAWIVTGVEVLIIALLLLRKMPVGTTPTGATIKLGDLVFGGLTLGNGPVIESHPSQYSIDLLWQYPGQDLGALPGYTSSPCGCAGEGGGKVNFLDLSGFVENLNNQMLNNTLDKIKQFYFSIPPGQEQSFNAQRLRSLEGYSR